MENLEGEREREEFRSYKGKKDTILNLQTKKLKPGRLKDGDQ